MTSDPKELTPVERRGDFWVKRDDHFTIGGVCGGKVRTCWHLSQGAVGLVTAGSRMSPQVNIVAHIAAYMGVPCRVHTPEGELSPEVKDAQACGADVIQHRAGYNNVIISRAHDDAVAHGWTEIPFGMDCQEAVEQTRNQVRNLPPDIKRIVMPVGSGMSLSGVLHGLLDVDRQVPVVGISVGAEPTGRLNRYAPREGEYEGLFGDADPNVRGIDWREMVEIKKSSLDYHAWYSDPYWSNIALDPIYEAKCIPFIEPGDLMWVVGVRRTFQTKDLMPADEVLG